MLPGLGFARDAGAALHNPLESAACGICTKSYRIGWQGRQRAKNTASHGNQMLLPGNWSMVGCSCGQFTAGTIFFFLAKWKFSRHPMCKGSNFRDHWMQSPCWRKKWSTSSEDPQGTADESRRFARTWDVQKIPRVWQPFRKSASPG